MTANQVIGDIRKRNFQTISTTALWILVLCGTGTLYADEPDYSAVLRGQDLAKEKCSRCHEVGREGQSTHPEALPFHNISKFYPVENLAEAFAEGIYVGHPDMPAFELSVGQLTDLLTYLKAVQPQK
ncbi:MAG: c-type cytochrome [Hyphomicrobiales bacterium]